MIQDLLRWNWHEEKYGRLVKYYESKNVCFFCPFVVCVYPTHLFLNINVLSRYAHYFNPLLAECVIRFISRHDIEITFYRRLSVAKSHNLDPAFFLIRLPIKGVQRKIILPWGVYWRLLLSFFIVLLNSPNDLQKDIHGLRCKLF